MKTLVVVPPSFGGDCVLSLLSVRFEACSAMRRGKDNFSCVFECSISSAKSVVRELYRGSQFKAIIFKRLSNDIKDAVYYGK